MGQLLCQGIAERLPDNENRIRFAIHNGESLDGLRTGAELVFAGPLRTQNTYAIVGIVREWWREENERHYFLEVRKPQKVDITGAIVSPSNTGGLIRNPSTGNMRQGE